MNRKKREINKWRKTVMGEEVAGGGAGGGGPASVYLRGRACGGLEVASGE